MPYKRDGFVDWLKGEMLAVVPIRLWRRYTGAARSVFYEMVCNHACLRPESEDVQQAFKELTGGME